jgi:hypothetical protein
MSIGMVKPMSRPVLTNKRYAFEIEGLDKGNDRVAMVIERVCRFLRRLVGSAEAEKSGATTRRPAATSAGTILR